MNNELEAVGKETVAAQFEAVAQHLPGEIEATYTIS